MALTLEKQLQAVNKDFKALSKRLDKLIVAAGKLEKGKTVNAGITKKAPAKAKSSASAASTKKAGTLTSVENVLGFIKRSKKSLDTDTLMKKTGYNRKKIANIVFKLKKRGQIKSTGKGLYAKA
jgi:hypothetical protein